MEYAGAKTQRRSTQPWNDTIRYGCRKTRVSLASVVENREGTPTGGKRHSCKIVLGRIGKEAELSRTVDGLDIGSEGERSRDILILSKRELDGGKKVVPSRRGDQR